MDYTYMGDDEDEKSPILVIKVDTSTATMAALVPCKGASVDWALGAVMGFLEFLGYKRLAIKTAQEPSILDLIRSIFADLDPNQHFGQDLDLQDQVRGWPGGP